MGLLFREHAKAQPEGGFRFHSFDRDFLFFFFFFFPGRDQYYRRLFFFFFFFFFLWVLLFREHPKAQPEGGF